MPGIFYNTSEAKDLRAKSGRFSSMQAAEVNVSVSMGLLRQSRYVDLGYEPKWFDLVLDVISFIIDVNLNLFYIFIRVFS